MGILLPIVIFGLVFGSVYLLSFQFYPQAVTQVKDFKAKREKETARAISEMALPAPAKRQMALFNLLIPFILAVSAFLFFRGNWGFTFSAAGLGLMLPDMLLRRQKALRANKFRIQLVDGLMILISALRGGLSLLQSIEVMVEEMPAPLSEEFGLVLREYRMGVTLEEALERLNKRMPSHELNLITTAVLVSRESGGDITGVLAKLVDAFRETAKIMEKVQTLTLQGKIQGIVMSALPLVFASIVYSANPKFLNIMFVHPMGKFLLGIAIVLQVVGSFLIWRLSKVDI